MHRLTTQREPRKDHTAAAMPADKADWESIRIFLEIVRSGSFRAAADRLGISFSAVRRRVVALEQNLGTLLMTRHTGGIRLTAEGERIAAAARQMEVASHDIVRTNESISPQISGNVKISTTKGTGTFWLIPRLVELQRAYPGLLIDFNCTMNPADVSNLEADVSVQLRRPSSPDLKITKLGRLHTMPFAAQSYIDLFGLPADLEDMARHRYALHVSEQTQAKKLFTDLFPGRPWSGLVAMTTNTASAHLWAISKGIGIGWLPTYAHLIGGRIVPVEAGPRFHLDVWLAYHPDVTKIARVRRVIDWIKESFDSKKFPWFGDEFIHPYDLPKSYLGQPLINLFEGFVQYPPLQPNDFPGLVDLQKPVQPEPTQT
jgi:molybdate transport repressor ModE-like protein